MAVNASRGELGFAKVGTDDLHAISVTPVDDVGKMIMPALGNFYPLNFTEGLLVPGCTVRTNPYSNFFTALKFGTWFGLGATTRPGELDPCGTVGYYDGYALNGITGAKADSFTLEVVQGGVVDLTMNFMGNGTTGTASALSDGTATVGRWAHCSFGTATGVVRAALSFSNRCYPSAEISNNSFPAMIHAGPPVFSLELDQKPGGVAPTTSEVFTIALGAGATAAFAMKFIKAAPVDRTVAFGETIYRRVYTGMRVAANDAPLAVTWS